MSTSLLRSLAASLLTAAAGLATAADTSPPAPPPATSPAPTSTAPADKLGPARSQIAARNWPAAIDELKRVNDTGSADWNNLMGYALRKQKAPDIAGSEKFYDTALRIDPNHRGALEYSGELYLMKGDLPAAEQRLAQLQSVCGTACVEYAELKDAIARHKANGGKPGGY